MVRPAVSPEPGTADEGGEARSRPAGPFLSWSSQRKLALPAGHRAQPASEPSAPQPRRTDHGHPRPSLRPVPHSRRPRPWCLVPAVCLPPPAARLPAPTVRLGVSAPRLAAAARPIQTKTEIQILALSAAIGPGGQRETNGEGDIGLGRSRGGARLRAWWWGGAGRWEGPGR